jgi:flagellar protein FliO/FliZ
MDDPTQYLRFAAALIFVLALIGAAVYALRAFGLVSLVQRRPNDRRLSVVESLLLDARRRLVIVRRDDKEHLILLSPSGETLVEGGFDAKPVAEPVGANVVAFKADAQL